MRAALAPCLLTAGTLAVAALWWANGSAPLAAPRVSSAHAPAMSVTLAARTRADVSPGRDSVAGLAPDPIGNAPDLKRVFDDYSVRGDAVSQRIAARAFGACVPVFRASQGQPPSPEPLIRALPSHDRDAREAAYRILFARCAGIAGEPRAEQDTTLRDMKDSAAAQEPGARAIEDLRAGRDDRIDSLVALGLAADDPAAVAGMSGVASALAQLRGSSAEAVRRAQEIDAALPLAACDLGLDCGAASLASLQLCALEGACEGDYGARVASRFAGVDAARVQAERARLALLMRSGRSLNSWDLLP
jgi:hypothetical protein